MRNCTDSAENRDYWRAPVNAVLNLRVPNVMELVSCSVSYLGCESYGNQEGIKTFLLFNLIVYSQGIHIMFSIYFLAVFNVVTAD